MKSEVREYYTDYDDAEEIWNRGDVTLSMEGYTLSSDDEGIRTEDGGKTLILSKGADADGSFRFRLDCQSELSEEFYQLPLTAVVRQIKESAGTSDVTIAQTVTGADGEPRYTVEVNARDLSAGSKLKIMKMDAKTGEYVLCNAKDYKVSASGGVSLSLKTAGTFVLLNESDAKAASDAILKTVQVKDSKKTVKAGKTAKLVLSSALNMKNVSGITYTVSDKSVAKVDKNGKVTAKKSGTVTVRAKVTLKNGRTKTVKMTVKVQ